MIRINVDLFHKVLKAMLVTVSTDETRYNLNGVHLELIESETLRFVSTDGHRVALIDCMAASSAHKIAVKTFLLKKEDADLLVRYLSVVVRKLKKNKSLLTTNAVLVFTGTKITITVEDGLGTELTFACIQGEFPDYRQIVTSAQKDVENTGNISPCYNSRYLADVDKAFNPFYLRNGMVLLEAKDELSPAILRPQYLDDNVKDAFVILMPMRK